ncbi:MAG TPA: nucleotidyl transferase AbiEii/AbiGii toxin family protein [Candidatus Diapherotrites archaeon]|uniref:Nucleotidyl transferase AbiEii/AbiGii toxin family protein n=1 Tax=Candidatus Iainarchaeum sp. TaxID=3101447 RepID=A0A7J4J4M8_9ARCH|nr:nucleotidyl transferase AbiEii/AbiGii toxin family protein [Candidatus Diapherotrites archaeon]
MIPPEMINLIGSELGAKNITYIEKDLYLQGLLLELEKSRYFREKFTFKGGTCLTKAYFGYYRFSEDLDFTWIRQEDFKAKSEKAVRRMLSGEITQLLELYESAAKRLGLDFLPHKHERRYTEFGSSNRFATFKFWYKASDSSEAFIKIQVNFLEELIEKPVKMPLLPLTPQLSESLGLEYPQYCALATKTAMLYCYTLKEIGAEKARAMLTRRGFKARDIIDLYYLSTKGITIQTEKQAIIRKTIFMLKYLKYKENLKKKKFEGQFTLGTEEKLMLTKPDTNMQQFADMTLQELSRLAQEVRAAAFAQTRTTSSTL